MTDTNIPQKGSLVERIRATVLSKYDGVKDICVVNAIKQWKQERCDPAATEPVGELHHTVTTPEMELLAVAWHHADIEENIALEHVKQARAKIDEARSLFITALAQHEGVYANSEDMHVLIARMEVWKADGEQLKRALPRKVIAFCLAVANGELKFDDLRSGYYPKVFKDLQLIQEFVNDLLVFCDENGDVAKQQIKGVCENLTVAHKVVEDSDATQPVRFLARQVVTTKSTQACLQQGGPSIGFGSAQKAG